MSRAEEGIDRIARQRCTGSSGALPAQRIADANAGFRHRTRIHFQHELGETM
jgi:hypothetical protein